MKTYFRYAIVVIILTIIGFITTNYFVSKKIKSLLAEESALTYSNLSVNAFAGSMSLSDVSFDEDTKQIKIEDINLNVDIIHYLINKEVIVQSIDASGFDIKLVIVKGRKKEKKKESKIDIVSINSVNLKEARVRIDEEDQTILKVSRLDLSAEDISWPLDEEFKWLENESIKVKAQSISYNLDKLHDLQSEQFIFEENSLTLKGFYLKPKFTKTNYVDQIQKQTDLMDLSAKTLKVSGFGLKKKDSLFNILVQKIEIDSTRFNIYRDKTIKPDNSIKPLYSEALRNLKFQLAIDSFIITEMNLTYEELLDKEREPGQLKFNAIRGQITNIHNGLKVENPDIEAKLRAKFSKDSEIYFNLSFVPDHETFYLSTLLQEVQDKSVNNFFAPAMRMELDGKINKIETSFSGNDTHMNGDFKIAYKKLKLNVLKKDGGKNNFASLLSNVFIRNRDVDDSYKLKEVERDQTKSFWNYVWTFHLEGLKKALL